MLIDELNQSVCLDIRSADFYNDPYPFYEQLQERCPMFHWTEHDLWTFARHADVFSILRDRRFGRQISHVQTDATSSKTTDPDWRKPFFDVDRLAMIGLEPPAHTRLRGLVQKAFMGRQIDTLRPRIESICDGLLDDIQRGDSGSDLLLSYATPIPVTVITEMLGVPIEMASELVRWSHDMVQMYEMRRTDEMERSAVKASQEFVSYLRQFIEHRRRQPTNDLISQLIRVEQAGESLSEDELIANVILLLNAGHEATVHAIGNGILALLKHPNQSALWRNVEAENAAEFEQYAVEELLRFDTPLHQFNRWVLEPLKIHGRRFEVGQEVALLLGAANRDPAEFQTPHKLNLTRRHNPHVSLGGGIHYCLGASLARLEIQIAVPKLLRRFPNLRLIEEPTYRNNFHFHGLRSLKVAL